MEDALSLCPDDMAFLSLGIQLANARGQAELGCEWRLSLAQLIEDPILSAQEMAFAGAAYLDGGDRGGLGVELLERERSRDIQVAYLRGFSFLTCARL